MEAPLPHGVPVYFVDNARYFDREGIYMYRTTPSGSSSSAAALWKAFATWVGGRMSFTVTIGRPRWSPTGSQTVYTAADFMAAAASVYTIHSLGFRGIFGRRVLEIAGIDEYEFVAGPEGTARVRLSTSWRVAFRMPSHQHSQPHLRTRDFKTPQFGEHLDALLRSTATGCSVLSMAWMSIPTIGHRSVPGRNYQVQTLDQRAENRHRSAVRRTGA